jgi:thioesterase domain-containing protein
MRLEYQANAIVDVLKQLVAKHCGANKSVPVRLIGHSYGGSVSIKVAELLIANGFSVEALVVFEANCFHLLPGEKKT